MKKLILIALLAMPTMAAPTAETCEEIGKFAEAMMKARQVGVDVSRALEISKGIRIYEIIAMEAYESPRFNMPENRRRAEEEFKTKHLIKCMRFVEDKKQ